MARLEARSPRVLETIRFASPDHEGEMVYGPPHPTLAPYATRFCGYREWSRHPLRRLEPPYGGLPLIIGFGTPLLITGDGYTRDNVDAFIAGLDVASARTEGIGHQAGVQLDLTPLGAMRVLGMPLEEIAYDLFHMRDVLGAEADMLRQQLGETNDWGRRIDLVEQFALRRIAAHRPPPALVIEAWQRIRISGGMVDVTAMAADAGVSRKHLTQQFRQWIGLPPAAYGRVLRFERAVERVRRSPGRVDWAHIAADCGYYDQPHFNRDFRQFTGMAPTVFLASLQPGGGIAAADDSTR